MKKADALASILQLFTEYMTDLDSYLELLPFALIVIALILYFLPTKAPATRQSPTESTSPYPRPQSPFQQIRKQLSLTKATKLLLFLPLTIGLLVFIKLTLFGANILIWGGLYLMLGR